MAECRHVATLVARKPDRSNSERSDYYLYDVIFNGETIVSAARDPEFDACRILLARGLTGKVTFSDRITVDIERGAKLVTRDEPSLRYEAWKPFPGLSRIGVQPRKAPRRHPR